MTEMTSHLNDGQLEALKKAAGDKLPEIIEYFGLDLKKGSKRYHGACPIHGGDKYNAFSISCEEVNAGNWKCYTRQCHEIFYADIIGLVRACISKTKYKWSGPQDEDKMASFREAIKFIVDMTGCESNLKDISFDPSSAERKKFINNIASIYNKKKVVDSMSVTKEQVRNSLQIPSPYHVSRGYSPEILEKYDIGYCGDYTKPFYKRSVAPVYNEDHTVCIGCAGRSIFERCILCDAWHNPSHKCPETKYERQKFGKWKNNYGFKGEFYLYNYWFSKSFIKESGIAIIVESPGNVWRLEEAGIHMSVGTFGAHITEPQKDILDRSGAMALIVLSDPDEAGTNMNKFIEKMCQDTYQLHFPRISPSDIGDTSIELIQNKLIPIIEQVKSSL